MADSIPISDGLVFPPSEEVLGSVKSSSMGLFFETNATQPQAASTAALSLLTFSPTPTTDSASAPSDGKTLPAVTNEGLDCTVQGKIKFHHDDTPGRDWVVTLSLPQSCEDFYKWELFFIVWKPETKQTYGPAEPAGWDRPCKHEVSCTWNVEQKNERTGTVVETLRASITHQRSPFLKFSEEAECTQPYYTALVDKIAELCEDSLTNAQAFQLSPTKWKQA